jgi:hypothetical protein
MTEVAMWFVLFLQSNDSAKNFVLFVALGIDTSSFLDGLLPISEFLV